MMKIKKSEALKTEEILSLLSKQNTDFQKESEISSNITKLYKKIDLVSLAKSKSLDKDKKMRLWKKNYLMKLKQRQRKTDDKNIEETNRIRN